MVVAERAPTKSPRLLTREQTEWNKKKVFQIEIYFTIDENIRKANSRISDMKDCLTAWMHFLKNPHVGNDDLLRIEDLL